MSETQQDSERKGNRLSKIVTRTGDAGTTGLGDGSRTTKDSLRIDAIGEVDELNSGLGVLLCEDLPHSVQVALLAHAAPQRPQFAASRCRSTRSPPARCQPPCAVCRPSATPPP